MQKGKIYSSVNFLAPLRNPIIYSGFNFMLYCIKFAHTHKITNIASKEKENKSKRNENIRIQPIKCMKHGKFSVLNKKTKIT